MIRPYDVVPLTVGQLKAIIADNNIPDDWPVQIHNEQDYPVDEWTADEDDGLVLFANSEPSPLLYCPTCGWQEDKALSLPPLVEPAPVPEKRRGFWPDLRMIFGRGRKGIQENEA